MSGDRWTFLVVRGEDTPVRQYSLSSRSIRAVAAAFALVSLILLGFGATAAFDASARIQNRQLDARNQALAAELEEFRSRVGRLESTLDDLSDRDDQIRTLAGLETIDPEVMQAGVGGPGLGSLESYPLWKVDSVASKDAFALSYDLNALERRARLLASSLDEATDSLQAHRDLLESTPSILPTAGWMTSSFAKSRMHPVHNRPLPHEGVDISAPKGTPIFAAAKGRVVRAGWVVGYGLTVEIDHGFGYTTLYGHSSKLLVKRGQMVSRGDVIAQVGSTGIATAPHLHYEVSLNGAPQNPANFILPDAVP
ncbi:MAG TPA: M23 family metallopeptidase [Longimicrobiales bacterium]|nr:M23 family metallopeptidase [Longimicrobiales bacterium]